MSKWTKYQILISLCFLLVITFNYVFYNEVLQWLEWLDQWILPTIVIVFVSIVVIVWSITTLLLLQLQKTALFTHPIWRIMPVVIGVILLLSLMIFILLGTTLLVDVPVRYYWLLDSSILYFLTLFYLLVLSIFVRYSTYPTTEKKIVLSAHTTIGILLFVILVLPSL